MIDALSPTEPMPATESAEPRVSLKRLSALSSANLAEWQRLAARALDPNPFQQPEFVLALADRLMGADEIRVLVVRRADGDGWLSAGAFQECLPSLSRPLAHLRSLASPYTFFDQPLVDRDDAPAAIGAAIRFVTHQRRWHGLRFRSLRAGGPQAAQFSARLEEFAVSRFVDRAWNRPVLNLKEISPERPLDRFSKVRRKSLARARRWLSSQGPVQFRLLRPHPADARPIDTFLELEGLGWKGDRGTAIARRPDHEDFFRVMAAGFARRGDLLFGELSIGDRVIASTCNLRAGDTLFGFKIGWHPDFAPGNPGSWSELELASAVRRECPELARIDSCSSDDSYTAALYSSSQPMVSAVCVWSPPAVALCTARQQFHRFKQSLRPRSP